MSCRFGESSRCTAILRAYKIFYYQIWENYIEELYDCDENGRSVVWRARDERLSGTSRCRCVRTALPHKQSAPYSGRAPRITCTALAERRRARQNTLAQSIALFRSLDFQEFPLLCLSRHRRWRESLLFRPNRALLIPFALSILSAMKICTYLHSSSYTEVEMARIASDSTLRSRFACGCACTVRSFHSTESFTPMSDLFNEFCTSATCIVADVEKRKLSCVCRRTPRVTL